MNSIAQTNVTTDELVGAMDAHGVPFLTGGIQSPRALAIAPAELVLGLARDEDARVQLALIPLLLVHPEYAEVIPEIADRLEGNTRQTLLFYYTAAYWLQRKFQAVLDDLLGKTPLLPDLFGKLLGIFETAPDAALTILGEIHRTFDDEPVNWRGTYEHAARRLLRHLAAQETWAV